MSRQPTSEPMDWERPSERFLAYVDRLAQAVVSHDVEELDKLLRMRLSSHLPRPVLEEVEFFRRAKAATVRAPLRLMRYRHKMRQLATAPADEGQLGLELRERDVAAPVKATRRRAVREPDPAPGDRRRGT